MKEDFIKLKFSLVENTPLLVGDYVDLSEVEGYNTNDETTKLFVIDRNYYPTFNKDTGGYDYDVQINAYYHQWKNTILKFNPSKGAAEASFSLTDTIAVHASIIKANLEHNEYTYGGNYFDVTLHGDTMNGESDPYGNALDKGMKAITYSAVTIYGAMDAIAQAFECEWWVVGNMIHFGYRKSNNTPIELTLNEELVDATVSDSDAFHATRIYAFGGTTNVSKHYRDKLEFTADTVGDGWFYDSKKPVYVDWVRGERVAQAPYTKSFAKDENSRNDAFTAMPSRKVEGGVNNLDLTFTNLNCLWKGDVDVQQNIDFTLNLGLGTSKNGAAIYDSKDIMTIPLHLFVGDINIKDNAPIASMLQEYNATDSFTLNVTNGKSYAINFLIVEGRSKACNVIFTDANGKVTYLSENSKVSTGYYTFYVYNMPSNGQLKIEAVLMKADAYEVKNIPTLSFKDQSTTFSIVADFKAYDHIRLRATKSLPSTDVKKDSTSKIDNVVSFDYDFETTYDFYYQATAQSVKTTMLVNGETEPREVYINADFEDDGYKISGTNLAKGTKFTFPDIILSKVGGDYFTTEEGGVQTGVVQKNLMLPKGTDYVGTDSKDAIEAIMVFNWIYPKTTLAISNVQPFDKYTVEEENEDGSTTTSYVTTYNITLPIKHYDNSLWVDPSQQFIIFQDGAAAGLRFEVNVESQTDETVTFQLIPNEDYVTWIPNASTIPSVGDNVILDGIDVTFIDRSVIEAAEQEVLSEANRMLSEAIKDDKVVDIILSPEYALERGRIALGSQAKLIGVLGDAYDSRVLGFEECLDIPYDKPKYIVGDKNYYNRTASIETKLENIEKGSITLSGVATNTGGGGGGTKVTIIKTKDSTKPTDTNVLSALRTEENFLHTKEDDTVEGNITFEKNISVNGEASVSSLNVSGDANVDGDHSVGGDSSVNGSQTIEGFQEVKGLQTLHEGLQTHNFNDAAGQITGAQLTSAGMLTVAGLKAMSFEVFELIYNVIRAQGGKMVLSNAATVDSVKLKINGIGELVDTYEKETNNIEYALITIKEDEHNKGANPFVKGDILYGYVNSIGESGKVSKGGECTMWVDEVLEGMTVKAKLFTVDASVSSTASNYYDVVGSNIAPTAAMALAQRGNKTDENRRTSIFLDGESGNIVMLQNVSTPRIKKEYYGTVNGILPTDLYNEVKGKFDGLNENSPVFYGEYGIFRNIIEFDHLGGFLQKERNRGVWSDVAEYENNARYYDVVTYGGQLWKCLRDNKGVVPTDGDDWLLLVSKGDDGTSIKVSGSFIDLDAFEAVWKPNGVWKEPEDHSQCYVVGQNLYVWFEEDRKWDSVGQFKGDKGDSVTGTTTQYAVNQSMTDKPKDANFSDNYPTSINEGDVLWTRTKVNIENHSSDWSYSASRQAKNGAKGDGLKSITTQYSVTKDANQPDVDDETKWKDTIDAWGTLVEGDYVWTATVYDYDASENDEVSISVSRIAENGTSVTTTGKYYIVSDSGTEAPSDDADWQTTIPTVGEGKYLWTRIDFSDGENAYSVSKNGESVKVEEIKYSTKFTASQPSDSTFTVDEPDELVIPNGGFLWCRTTFSGGKKIYTKSYQGMDNTSVQWTIHTNTNTISVEEKGHAEGYVDVWVGKQTSQGYSEIKDSIVLATEGLKVMYYTDGHTLEATELTLEENEPYTFDDGSTISLNGILLSVENTVVDLKDVSKSITFVLVKSNVATVTDADIIASREVLVVNPDYTLSIEMDTNIFSIAVDGETKESLEGKTHIAKGVVKLGGREKELSMFTLSANSDLGSVAVGQEDGKFTVSYTHGAGVKQVNLPEYIDIHAVLDNDTDVTGTTRIVFQYPQRGLVGAAGAQGAMLMPQGEWDGTLGVNDDDVVYELETDIVDGKSVVVGRPMVYHDSDDNGEGDYYVLQKNITKEENVEDELTKGNFWKKVQKIKYLFTEVLMANFAKLGKAVFYGRYMFSADGIRTSDGQSMSWEDFDVSYDGGKGGGRGAIFDKGNDKLSGQFVPQLFLDFKGGGAKFGKLSESFITIGSLETKHTINLEGCHNIKQNAVIQTDFASIISLPSGNINKEWYEDGTNCTIVHGYNFDYSSHPTDDQFRNSAIAVCADGRLLDADMQIDEGTFLGNSDENGWFIWRGYRTKVVFLAPGSILKLRSVKSNDSLHWYIENSSDFEVMDTIVNFYNKDKDDASKVVSRNDTTATGLNMSVVFVGSPIFNKFQTVVYDTDSNNNTFEYKTQWAWKALGNMIMGVTGYLWHE